MSVYSTIISILIIIISMMLGFKYQRRGLEIAREFELHPIIHPSKFTKVAILWPYYSLKLKTRGKNARNA